MWRADLKMIQNCKVGNSNNFKLSHIFYLTRKDILKESWPLRYNVTFPQFWIQVNRSLETQPVPFLHKIQCFKKSTHFLCRKLMRKDYRCPEDVCSVVTHIWWMWSSTSIFKKENKKTHQIELMLKIIWSARLNFKHHV